MRKKIRSLHRSIGAVIVLFVLMLAVTGILLNHTTDLKLDQHYITSEWLLKHYGIDDIKPDVVYLLDQHVVSQFGSQVFIDTTPVLNSQSPIIGGIVNDDLMILATRNNLLLFSHEGELIEKMGASAGIPPLIQNIGLFHGDPVIQTRQGMWRSDFMLDQWEPISLEGIGWSVPQQMPEDVGMALTKYFHGKGISVERFILDLHNGHILGKLGTWFIDLLGLLMIIISLTGLWMWTKRTG